MDILITKIQNNNQLQQPSIAILNNTQNHVDTELNHAGNVILL